MRNGKIQSDTSFSGPSTSLSTIASMENNIRHLSLSNTPRHSILYKYFTDFLRDSYEYQYQAESWNFLNGDQCEIAEHNHLHIRDPVQGSLVNNDAWPGLSRWSR